MGGRRTQVLAVAGIVTGLTVLLVATGPSPERETSGPIRRVGGVCLQLERWGLLGWRVVGQSHGVSDIHEGAWHPHREQPPCATGVREQDYLIRPPFDAPPGTYRICGLADQKPCLEFRLVEFVPGPPGP